MELILNYRRGNHRYTKLTTAVTHPDIQPHAHNVSLTFTSSASTRLPWLELTSNCEDENKVSPYCSAFAFLCLVDTAVSRKERRKLISNRRWRANFGSRRALHRVLLQLSLSSEAGASVTVVMGWPMPCICMRASFFCSHSVTRLLSSAAL